jgi:hypothetical protein
LSAKNLGDSPRNVSPELDHGSPGIVASLQNQGIRFPTTASLTQDLSKQQLPRASPPISTPRPGVALASPLPVSATNPPPPPPQTAHHRPSSPLRFTPPRPRPHRLLGIVPNSRPPPPAAMPDDAVEGREAPGSSRPAVAAQRDSQLGVWVNSAAREQSRAATARQSAGRPARSSSRGSQEAYCRAR